MEFLIRLFDSSEFLLRQQGGGWTIGLVCLHTVSDGSIWIAYLVILVTVVYVMRRRQDLPFPWMCKLIVAFIVVGGLAHLMELITFHTPLYRLSGVIKLVTALVSWMTVLGLIPLVPKVLKLRSPEELEREIAERERAQAALEKAHAELENRVRERTIELSRTNALLKEQILQRERAEEERARLLAREQAARAEAEAANRTKDEFLATLSHELRTPLNSMLGWTRMLRQENLPPATVQRGLETIERNVKVQTQLINDLLDVSRIIRGKLHLELSYIDLVPVMEAALDAIRPAAEAKNIRLEILLEPSAGPVAADFDRLQQVVWNLLSNAIKFTPRGGRVQVRLDRVDSQVEMSVRDTGPGISPEFLPHVFERFRQADSKITRSHAGLGLGLAIVRHLVELHGGTVAAESAGEGKGATFRVRLPIRAVHLEPDSANLEAGARQEEAASSTPAALDGLRLLVVDDEPDAREVLALVLERSGAEVAAFGSAREALEAIESVRPDVLVSDIGMPGEDGYTLLRKVRALGPARGGQVPAVALTAYAKAEDRKRALASGFARHISKPVEPADLIATVAKLAGLH